MKKIILGLVVFLGFAGVIMGQEFTFRGFKWGTSIQAIVEKEGLPDPWFEDTQVYIQVDEIKNRYAIWYRNKIIAGYSATIDYYFSKETEGLIETSYFISDVDLDDCENLFNDIINQLEALYGKQYPIIEDSRLWVFGYRYVWNYHRTMITARLDTFSRRARISIRYISPETDPNPFGEL
jgi:hypothetical protein